MKNQLITLVFLVFLTNIYAQEPPLTKIDSMLAQIDKTTFTTGILYDRVSALANLSAFNSNSNMSFASHFEQALFELHKASNEQKFISPFTLRESYTSKHKKNEVDIGILSASFNQLNYNSNNESDQALRINNDAFEKIPNDLPPFTENHALIISPLKQFLVGTSIRYKFDNTFLFDESNEMQLVNIEANFDAGQEVTIMEDGVLIKPSLIVNYDNEGYKVLTFTATLSDGQLITTQSTVHVKIPVQSNDATIENFVITAEESFTGYEPGDVPLLGHLEYRVYYHTTTNDPNKIVKPIVIIDGFDPGDKRKFTDADSNLPAEVHNSIEEFMIYYNNEGLKVDIIKFLRERGYDVILVNHPTYEVNGIEIDGGADYVERNGLTHVTLYTEINNQLSQNNSDEELIIVGPSMGGLISRYALAYMEAEDIEHHTKLWISIDSPHLGANIPIGLQTLINQLKSESTAAVDFVNNQLGSFAAKQQLIEQYKGWENNGVLMPDYLNGRTIGQGFSSNRGHPFYVNFYNNLYENGLNQSRGYPQNLRKIALINGSLKGLSNFVNPFTGEDDSYASDGQIGLNVRGFQEVCLSPIGPCFPLHVASLESHSMPSFNNYGKISRFKKAFEDKSKYVTNINSRGTMDNIPGGYFDGYNQIAASVDGSDPTSPGGGFFLSFGNTFSTIFSTISDILGGAEFTVYSNEYVHSFIPTASSLGFINPDFNWAEDVNRNLACSGETPFDSYFGPKLNEQHTSFTADSFEWLKKEIFGIPQSPSVYLNGDDLEGPYTVCYDDQATYDFGSCGVAVENWEVSDNIEIIVSDENDITVRSLNEGTSGFGFIKANFNNHSAQKTVWVGAPTQIPQITAETQNFPDSPTNFTFELLNQVYTNQGTVLEKDWEIYPGDMVSDYDTPFLSVTTPENSGVYLDYYLKFRNECGWSPENWKHGVSYDDDGPHNEQLITLYPNSSDVDLKVDFTIAETGNYNLKIYDQYSVLLYEGNSTNVIKTINTLDFPEGLFYVHIIKDGEETIIKQVMINH
jgi:hypothetical protein